MSGKNYKDNFNDTKSRRVQTTREGFKQTVPAKHVFGNPEEISTRVGGTFPTLPDNVPSNFRQLGPDGSGSNVNDARPKRYSGNQKFGDPRRFTGG